MEGRSTVSTNACVTKEAKGLGFFEKYLTVWVVLCIIAGIALVIAGAIMKPKFSILDYRREQMRRGGPPSRRRSPNQPVQKGDLEPKKKKQ